MLNLNIQDNTFDIEDKQLTVVVTPRTINLLLTMWENKMKNLKWYTLILIVLVIMTLGINKSYGIFNNGGANMCYHNGEYYANSGSGSLDCPDPGPEVHQQQGHLTVDDPECLITSSEIQIE